MLRQLQNAADASLSQRTGRPRPRRQVRQELGHQDRKDIIAERLKEEARAT